MPMTREEMDHRINHMPRHEMLAEFRQFIECVGLQSLRLDTDMSTDTSVIVQASERAPHEHLAAAVKMCALNAGHTLGCGPLTAADLRNFLQEVQQLYQSRSFHPSFPELTPVASSE